MKPIWKRFWLIICALGIVGGGMAMAGWLLGGSTRLTIPRQDGVLIFSPWGLEYRYYDGMRAHGLENLLEGLEDGVDGFFDGLGDGVDGLFEGIDDSMDGFWDEKDNLPGDDMQGGTTMSETTSKELEQLTQMDISTISANIEIQTGPSYSIAIENNSNSVELRYSVDQGKLKVEEKQIGVSLVNLKSNRLTITLPEGAVLTSAKVNSVSGGVNIDVDRLSADSLTVSTTSGGIDVQDVQAQEFDLSSVSGKIELEGDGQQKVRAKTTSGKVSLSGDLRGEITAATVSGRVELDLDGPMSAYSYECSSVSGKIEVGDQSAKRRLTGGSGENSLRLSSTSGSLIASFND